MYQVCRPAVCIQLGAILRIAYGIKEQGKRFVHDDGTPQFLTGQFRLTECQSDLVMGIYRRIYIPLPDMDRNHGDGTS